jgi:hypothetical protein
MPNQCYKIQGDRDLWIKWNYPTSQVSLCGEDLPYAFDPATVVGDPVTWHGNVREEFSLPTDRLSPLLRSPDMHVFASARPGHEEDEWIDRVVITSAAGDTVLDVSMKRNLTYFDRATMPPNAFETLSVRMDWATNGHLSVMPPADAQFTHSSGISLGFGRVRHFGQIKAGDAPRREGVYVVSNSLKVLIISSAAREYFTESKHLGMEYSHLDLEIMQVADPLSLGGILPELWGLQPMSEETKALRKNLPTEQFNDGPRRVPLKDYKIVHADETSSQENQTDLTTCNASSDDGALPNCDENQVSVGSVEGYSPARGHGRESLSQEGDDIVAAL